MPPRSTREIVFRPPDVADVSALLDIFGDPDAMRFLPEALIRDPERMRKYIAWTREAEARLGYGLWIVEDRRSGAIAAVGGLVPFDGVGPDVELVGYSAGRFAGLRLAVAAGRAILSFAFDELGLPRVIATTAPGHSAAQGVLRTLGFRFVERRDVHGHEMVVFAVAGRDAAGLRIGTNAMGAGDAAMARSERRSRRQRKN